MLILQPCWLLDLEDPLRQATQSGVRIGGQQTGQVLGKVSTAEFPPIGIAVCAKCKVRLSNETLYGASAAWLPLLPPANRGSPSNTNLCSVSMKPECDSTNSISCVLSSLR